MAYYIITHLFVCLWRNSPSVDQGLLIHEVSRSHTTTHQSVGLLWTSRRSDLYLTTHNTHNRQITRQPLGFEPTISAIERPHSHALDRAASEIGIITLLNICMHIHICNIYILTYSMV